MVTFGGDDVCALVIDIGMGSTKLGYAGEEGPKHVFPSLVGSLGGDQESSSLLVGENGIYPYHASLDIISPFDPVTGMIQNWAAWEALLDYAFHKRLRVNPSEYPVLLVEPSYWLAAPSTAYKEQRDKIMALFFEKYQVPALYLEKSAVLSCFTAGKPAGLVVESGAGMTCISPVYDGHLLSKGVQAQPLAGNLVNRQAQLRLANAGIHVTPQYLVGGKVAVDAGRPPNYTRLEERSAAVTSSYHQMAIDRVLRDFKETVCQISASRMDDKTLANKAKKRYEFPDGYSNLFAVDRFKIPEALFDPAAMLPPQSSSTPSVPLTTISKLVLNSVQSCDVDMRNQLLSNIIVTGGNTLLPGFTDRLNTELYYGVPGAKVKLLATASTVERKFGAWIGGSILASLGTFQQNWISKSQYEVDQ